MDTVVQGYQDCWYTISLCDGVMHDENGYDACGCARFQYSTDRDEENVSNSNLTSLMTGFAGECTVVESMRGAWDETMGEV